MWLDENEKIVDEQNGFRKKRSTVDHISSLFSIIESRIKKKQSTFAAFIDFRKAYDCVNRTISFEKLNNIGVKGKMYIQPIYSNVSCCVKVNENFSDWFNVNLGLRQGCILSPILFNCFINDLAIKIKALGMGIDIEDGEKLSILLFADDIVLLASNERDL